MTPSQLNELLSGQRKGILAGLLRGLLWPCQLPYHLAVRYRNRRFERNSAASHQMPVPVVSVGNITVGGTGKTPLVAWIAQWFRKRGVRVTLLSRGYGAAPGMVNDEALELEQRIPDVPHLQDRDRVKIAHTAMEELDAQLLLMDDGFQHRRLRRDLDIVLIDATEPFGYGHVLPRGKLRESLRGLGRADLIVITRASAVTEARRQQVSDEIRRYSSAPQVVVDHAPQNLVREDGTTASSESMRGKRIAAFCGIGNPAGFRHTLESCGYEVVAFREFPDHHRYDRDGIEDMIAWLSELEVDAAVCTHKDLVKIRMVRLGRVPLWAQTIGIHFVAGQQALDDQLSSLSQKIELG